MTGFGPVMRHAGHKPGDVPCSVPVRLAGFLCSMNYSALISAIMAVESGGRDQAIGDGGRALGPLQIHRAVVQDVNRFAGTSYRWEGMTNRADARKVCELYLTRYAKGRSMQDAARIWNGGPTGHTKSATKSYWTKVNRHLSPELAKN